jgi:malate dehydrogenase (oxaloacetate-decarboxylating)
MLYRELFMHPPDGWERLQAQPLQSFPNQDGMKAQLEGHLMDVNRTADYTYDSEKMRDAIDVVVVTDSEAILGIGGEQLDPYGISNTS